MHEEKSLPEIMEEFRGRYVAVTVTERDANGQPTKGTVIESHFDKHKLRDIVRVERAVCIFYAGPTPMEGFVAVL